MLVLLLPGIHQGIVLKSAGADHVALKLQHVVHYGGKLVELLFLAGRCHLSQDSICLRVGHARAAIRHLRVDAGDVRIALFCVSGVQVLIKLGAVDTELGHLLR